MKNTVYDKLKASNPISNVRALIACIAKGTANHDEVNEIKRLTESPIIVMGHTVGDWATAVLDILNLARYEGHETGIKDIIENAPGQPWVIEIAKQLGVS